MTRSALHWGRTVKRGPDRSGRAYSPLSRWFFTHLSARKNPTGGPDRAEEAAGAGRASHGGWAGAAAGGQAASRPALARVASGGYDQSPAAPPPERPGARPPESTRRSLLPPIALPAGRRPAPGARRRRSGVEE